MGLPLFFLPNLPGATFIHGGTFISDLRAVEEISASQLWRWNSTTGILENEGNLWKSNQIWKIEPKGEDLVNIYREDSQSGEAFLWNKVPNEDGYFTLGTTNGAKFLTPTSEGDLEIAGNFDLSK